MTMTSISLRGLCKVFGQTVAVDDVDLDVAAGELYFLLGPSGCGKTTLLRMIAGFTEPTRGSIHFGPEDVTHLAANRRQCGMVFQNYALWPHMSVRQNVAFGLEVRKVSAPEKTRRIDTALQTVQMQEYGHRKPNELSGGQQQRVALARALVIEPRVLLLDEPLSNLDAKLRLEMRSQIKGICKDAGITAVYVTHDQKEALSMADTVAVLDQGRVVQVGTPRQLYHRPNSRFVADFLGETNFISAEVVERQGDQVVLECTGGLLRSSMHGQDIPTSGQVTCSIRPEAICLVAGDSPMAKAELNHFHARCDETVYLGEIAQYRVTVGESMSLKVFELNPRQETNGQRDIHIVFDPSDVVILRD